MSVLKLGINVMSVKPPENDSVNTSFSFGSSSLIFSSLSYIGGSIRCVTPSTSFRNYRMYSRRSCNIHAYDREKLENILKTEKWLCSASYGWTLMQCSAITCRTYILLFGQYLPNIINMFDPYRLNTSTNVRHHRTEHFL